MAKLKKTRFTPAEVEILARQYAELREQEAEIKRQKDKLSGKLKEYADINGILDEKGSKYVQTGNYVFGKQARTSVGFVQDIAVNALTKRGLLDAVDVVRTVNEEKFEQLVGEGAVTVDEFIDLGAITQKTSYAIFVKSIDAMSEVEVSRLGKS